MARPISTRSYGPPAVIVWLAAFLAVFASASAAGQTVSTARVERGSETAKQGFRNETEIAAKFNNWRTDPDARKWLAVLGYVPANVENVTATKPHGEKADIVVTIGTGGKVRREGISIKLVSGASGFNQIDKRWLAQYARLWAMPTDIVGPLKTFLGETPPSKKGRSADRMFLNELEKSEQAAVVKFFRENRTRILSDIFQGDGQYAAKWMLVAHKSTGGTRWTLRSMDETIKYFGEGDVAITRGGNLRIGRVTMQRKGGDGGRETAKMLQFKIDPTQLFDAN